MRGVSENCAAALLDIAELGERAQDPPRRRARDIGGERGLRQRHRRPLLAERAEHGEALGERRHELLVVGHATAFGRASAWPLAGEF